MHDKVLSDTLGRKFPYLRLSITDICNFRCNYCLPDGYKKTKQNDFLTKSEMVRLIRAFVELGTWKVRITGGEPLLRRDLIEIITSINAIDGIKNIALTTNGYHLVKNIKQLKSAGLTNINISLDSLNPTIFKNITDHNRCAEVLNGINECLKIGINSVKVNTVLLKKHNSTQVSDFIDFVKDIPITLRFIELMETIDNREYFKENHISSQSVIDQLLSKGWLATKRKEGDGPAIEYTHKNSLGKIGIIAPYSKDFCLNCNRLRISSRGSLHLCLFGNIGYNLRNFLKEDSQIEELKNKVRHILRTKPAGHFLHSNNSGSTNNLSFIGG